MGEHVVQLARDPEPLLASHNVAIYTDASATKALFVGERVSDAATPYDVPALEAGDYFFRYDVHPTMTGTITAQG